MVLICSATWNGTNSIPQTAATTVAFSSVCFFFFGIGFTLGAYVLSPLKFGVYYEIWSLAELQASSFLNFQYLIILQYGLCTYSTMN